MNYAVLSTMQQGQREMIVHRTDDAENASAFAESHHIRTGAFKTRAVAVLKNDFRTLRDSKSRDYVWQKVS